MQGDRAAPAGTSVKVLITQRSRVQIPPPPPLLSWDLASHLLSWLVSSGWLSTGLSTAGSAIGCAALVAPQDELRYRLGGGGVQAGQYVAVGIERESDGRVPEPLADDLGRHARRQRRTCVAVADVVQPDLGQPGGAAVLLEPAGDQVRMDRCAVWPGEHQPRVPVAGADHGLLLGLT